jgi:hypothetical protein
MNFIIKIAPHLPFGHPLPKGARVKLPFLAQMGLHFGGYVNDYTNFPLAPWGEGARRAGEGLNLCKDSK